MNLGRTFNQVVFHKKHLWLQKKEKQLYQSSKKKYPIRDMELIIKECNNHCFITYKVMQYLTKQRAGWGAAAVWSLNLNLTFTELLMCCGYALIWHLYGGGLIFSLVFFLCKTFLYFYLLIRLFNNPYFNRSINEDNYYNFSNRHHCICFYSWSLTAERHIFFKVSEFDTQSPLW